MYDLQYYNQVLKLTDNQIRIIELLYVDYLFKNETQKLKFYPIKKKAHRKVNNRLHNHVDCFIYLKEYLQRHIQYDSLNHLRNI